MRCINCSYNTKRERRSGLHVPSLPPDILAKLSRWLTIKELPKNGVVCNSCYDLLNSEADGKRLLGHSKICLSCGRSILRLIPRQYKIIDEDNPLLLNFTEAYLVKPENILYYLCLACLRRCERQLIRASKISTNDISIDKDDAIIHDISATKNEIVNDDILANKNRTAIVKSVNKSNSEISYDTDNERNMEEKDFSDDTPGCIESSDSEYMAPKSKQKKKSTERAEIILRNYKRTPSTRYRCIFRDCKTAITPETNKTISFERRKILLIRQNLYITRDTRECGKHDGKDWDEVHERCSIMSNFTAEHMEDLINMFKKTSNRISFEDVGSMSDNFCCYCTGLTVNEFLSYHNSLKLNNIMRSKTALAIHLAKLNTGASNVRLAMLFDMTRSILERLLKVVREHLKWKNPSGGNGDLCKDTD